MVSPGTRRLAEFCFVDGEEIHRRAAFGRTHLPQTQHARRLRHALDHQHARHDRIVRKMSDELRLVDRDVLDADAVLVAAMSMMRSIMTKG